MKEHAKKLKAEAGAKQAKKDRSGGERDVPAKISEMPPSDRTMRERLDAIIKATASALVPRTWYGMPALKAAYDPLTPGRQRAYLFYFSQAKQPKTRASRVAKCIPQILQGKRLND